MGSGRIMLGMGGKCRGVGMTDPVVHAGDSLIVADGVTGA